MKRVLLLAWAAAAIAVGGPGARLPALAQAAPNLVLTPPTGNAPSAGGTLSGSGWNAVCRGVGVSGDGISGTASIGPGGVLSGTFAVTGAPGELVTVTVTASCSPSNLIARANFRFNDPTPTPQPTSTNTPTATALPTATPTPTATATPTATVTPTPTPTASPTPTPTAAATASATRPSGATQAPATATTAPSPTPTAATQPGPPPGQGRIRILGCDPAPSDVAVRLKKFGSGEGGAAAAAQVTRAGSPGTYDFALPLAVAADDLFEVTATVLDPACPPSAGEPTLWKPGAGGPVAVVTAGKTTLTISSAADQIPKGEFGQWVTYYERKGTLHLWRQAVRTTSTAQFDAVRWQVSLQPFSSAQDPLAADPDGLLAYGDHSCVGDCIFVIEFDDFIPAPAGNSAAGSVSWANEAAGVLLQVLNLVPSGAGGGAASAQAAPPASPVKGAAVSPQVVQAIFAAPMNVYFRTVPMKAGVPVGPVSNSAIWRWTGPYDSPDPTKVKFPDCKANPKTAGCIQPPKVEPPSYEVTIASYHGWIAPKSGHYGCYLVTKTTTVPGIFGEPNEYPEGTSFCPPEPKEPGFLEAVVSFVVDTVNWVSNTYKALKEEVVSFVAQFVPAELCPKSCIETLVNAGLVALGLPPDIPNFNELANQGIDYLAEQAAESVGIPKEIQDLAGPAKDLAVAEFKKQVKEQFKKGIEAGLAEMEKSLSSQVSWIPDGLPIKPDPLGDYQPPAAVAIVKRKPGSKECAPGHLTFSGWGYNTTPAGKAELGGEAWNYLYEGKGVPVPPLIPGDSITIPVTLKPHFSWGYPGAKYTVFADAAKGWSNIYIGGTVELRVIGNPCLGGDTITVPSDGQVVGQVVGP